jgi:hypothetical protein
MTPESPWSPAAITGLIAALVTLTGAVTAMLIALQGLRRKADETAVKVDGHLAATTGERLALQAEIKGLKQLVESQATSKKVADALATRNKPAPRPKK